MTKSYCHSRRRSIGPLPSSSPSSHTVTFTQLIITMYYHLLLGQPPFPLSADLVIVPSQVLCSLCSPASK